MQSKVRMKFISSQQLSQLQGEILHWMEKPDGWSISNKTAECQIFLQNLQGDQMSGNLHSRCCSRETTQAPKDPEATCSLPGPWSSMLKLQGWGIPIL